MSVTAMAIVWASKLSRIDKLVLLAYADHADDDGSSAYPSQARVSWKTGYSPRQVTRIVVKLIDKGYMEPTGETTLGTIEYRIHLEKLPKLPPFKSRKGVLVKKTRTGTKVTDVLTGVPDTAMANDPSLLKEYNNGPEPELEKPRDSESWNELLYAITAVAQRDPLTLVEDDRIVVDIIVGKISPAEIEKHYGDGGWWFVVYWKGKRGQKPTFKDVGETYLKAQSGGDKAPQEQGSIRAWKEVKDWLNGVKSFKKLDNHAQEAVRVVTESTLRTMGKGNEHQLRQRFLTAWKDEQEKNRAG